MTDRSMPLYDKIYELVRLIPSGRVSTYGRIASQLGTTPRVVGFAMAALPPHSGIPWQRVINSLGKVSRRSDGDGNILQQDLLEAEGIVFLDGRIDLKRYLWTAPIDERL